MEVNRYLIAALYVMAGCAVTIPLKAQVDGVSVRSDRCRQVVTHTVRTVSACMQQAEEKQDNSSLPPDYYSFPKPEFSQIDYVFARTVRINAGPLCRTSHKIRAPEVV
ncbi:MAG: hypothetical protein K2L23_05340 [Odoribacter sp.]|nr:hypothetical protein [Odoribacter sp.]